MTEESEEKCVPKQMDVLEESSSFFDDMHSHLAYGIHLSTTEFDHQKGLDESEIMPIYSRISKQGFEDLQAETKISIVSKIEESSPGGANIVRCASEQGPIEPRISTFSGIIQHSSPRDAGLVNPEILYSQKKEGRLLNSNTHLASSCMSGIYVRNGKDVLEENCSFVHDIDSHVAYSPCSFTKDVQGKALDESEIEPAYSWNGFEDLQSKPNITLASKTKESSPRDIDLVKCTSKQGFEYLHLRSEIGKVSNVIRNSSPRDPHLVHTENLYSLRKNRKSLTSSIDQLSPPRMCGNYVKTWKSPPKFRGTPIGALYASRLSNKVASYPHQEHYDSLSTRNCMYTSRFSDQGPSHSYQEQFSSFRRSNSTYASRFSDSHQEQKYFFSRSNSHGSRLTNQSRNNGYKHCGFVNDQVRGPRASGSKSTTSSPDRNSYLYAQKDNFNKADFEVNYEQAKFFMIKSFSEDDVHRSIKYSVWASTPNGNKKLDAAFRKAEMEKMEKSKPCPVFLFFSVNTSGQFVGLAEMIGPVDFKKDMDFWEQNKWNGFFPVKWHIVKDIPNRIFQHITLENNYDRAVTYSRDTQEIFLPQGLSMLRIFKNYPLRTSILDDTDFYEKKEMAKEKSIPQHGGMDFVPSPMMHLESSFRNMSMSTRAVKPGDTSMHSPTSFAKRRPFNND